jgi:phosphatidylserine decarboxylase
VAKTLSDWVQSDVKKFRDRPIEWLSQYFFFRDPPRPSYSDSRYFFSPADGIVLYQQIMRPDEPLVTVKGKPYSLRTALRDESFGYTCLITGVFMTFFDVHVNRVP